jgi:predicted RNA-binding protein with PIN domain
MPGKKIIIDGYNLIKANPDLFSKMSDLESQRTHILKILQSAPALLGQDILLVFDGTSGHNFPAAEKKGRIQFIFSGKNREADEVIQNLIRKNAAGQKMLVISSDHSIRNTARDHRVSAITSQEFWKTLLGSDPKTRPATNESSSSNRQLSDNEVQEWLKLFQKREKSGNED